MDPKQLQRLLDGDITMDALDDWDFPFDEEVLALEGKNSKSTKPLHKRKHYNWENEYGARESKYQKLRGRKSGVE